MKKNLKDAKQGKIVTRNDVYSKAYHSEKCKSRQAVLARKAGQEAVRKWEEGKRA